MRAPQLTDPDPEEDTDPKDAAGDVDNGFREEKTVPAETRTVKLGNAAPWMATPDPPPREEKPRDPMFWPVVAFASVLLVSVTYVLMTQPKGHSHTDATLIP